VDKAFGKLEGKEVSPAKELINNDKR